MISIAISACPVGRELQFDPLPMQFPGDAEGNRLLSRDYRNPLS